MKREPAPRIRVTAGVLRRNGRILIARRTAPPSLAGLWEFPGGKVEAGETPRECLARELREELGLQVRVGKLLHRHRHTSPRGRIELYFFEVSEADSALHLRDHDAVAWVSPPDLTGYDWVPADGNFAQRLSEELTPPSFPV
jgi:8-oxo-dGTP diphosphatase